MGSDVEANEVPHYVTLTGSCLMAVTEVTNDEYIAALRWAYDQGYVTATAASVLDQIDGSTEILINLAGLGCQVNFNNGVFSTSYPDHPVVDVTWFGAVAYCDWLSVRAGLPRAYDHGDWSCNGGYPYLARGYRLPTEAEWELACRAGSRTIFNTGDCLDAGTEANYVGTDPYLGCPVGTVLAHTANVRSYPANAWGLYDMHGNVYEWCHDWYGNYDGNVTDPVGAEVSISGFPHRMRRGGSWDNSAHLCRSSNRSITLQHDGSNILGFRVVRLAD